MMLESRVCLAEVGVCVEFFNKITYVLVSYDTRIHTHTRFIHMDLCDVRLRVWASCHTFLPHLD